MSNLEKVISFNETISPGLNMDGRSIAPVAARAGKFSNKYDCSGSNNIDEVAVWNSDKLASVGSKTQNELGIFDNTGNVW